MAETMAQWVARHPNLRVYLGDGASAELRDGDGLEVYAERGGVRHYVVLERVMVERLKSFAAYAFEEWDREVAARYESAQRQAEGRVE